MDGTISILIITNALYSIPIYAPSKSQPRSLKHTIAGLPLVFAMQFLKILLPWTLTTEIAQFPFLFASWFSLIYLILFKGYKDNYTLGESLMHRPWLFGVAVIVFLLSLQTHQEPALQATIFLYLVGGIILFRNYHLIDKKVICYGSVYILLGIILLFWLLVFL